MTELPRLVYCRENQSICVQISRIFADHNNSYYIRWCGVTVAARHCHIRPQGNIRECTRTSQKEGRAVPEQIGADVLRHEIHGIAHWH